LRLDADGNARENLIAPPRGLPDDASRETVVALAEARDRSPRRRPSWLTLDEMLAFDWEHEVERSGWLPLGHYPRFLEIGRPPDDMTWSIDQLEAEGAGYAYLSEDEARRLLDAGPQLAIPRPREDMFVRVQWREPYRHQAKEFVRFLEDSLTPLGSPDDVRIVFLT
jgi:hypothetical protein